MLDKTLGYILCCQSPGLFLAAAVLAAAAVLKLLCVPMQFARKMLWAPVHLFAARWAAGRAARKNRARERSRAKQAASDPSKSLPRPQRMVYSSNVSK